MSVTVYIPTPFRSVTANQAYVEAGSATVAELLAELTQRYPELDQRLHDDSGQLHRYINIYVNKEEIEDLQGQDTPLRPGDEVSLIPALAGGAIGRPFTPTQVRRYSRHLLLPEVGPVGQRKLLNAKVLLIGAGGLGSPTAFYLAAAGVGTLGIVDFDEVDLSNLQRQILHQEKDVGRPKVDSARETLTALNPDVQVVAHDVPLHAENALEIFESYDIIVNGCDNFPTRYLANDAAYFLKKPLVDGGINQFEGLVSIYMPGDGCYRCLYPAPPPPGAVPSCAEAGVLGVLPGIVGSMQALETIKLILGIGDPLIGRLLLFDALAVEFRTLRTRRDPGCPVCGETPTINELIDYEEFCGVPPPTKETETIAAGAATNGTATPAAAPCRSPAANRREEQPDARPSQSADGMGRPDCRTRPLSPSGGGRRADRRSGRPYPAHSLLQRQGEDRHPAQAGDLPADWLLQVARRVQLGGGADPGRTATGPEHDQLRQYRASTGLLGPAFRRPRAYPPARHGAGRQDRGPSRLRRGYGPGAVRRSYGLSAGGPLAAGAVQLYQSD